MDNILNLLKVADVKQQDLGKSFDQSKALASSLLQFTLQWKDVEGHFASAKNCLLKHAQKIDLREKEVLELRELVEERSKEVEIKWKRVDECWNDIPLKEEELKVLKASILECSEELESKERSLASAKKTLKECSEELDVRKQQLTEVSGELEFKERELSSSKTLLEECCKEFQVKETQLGLIKKSTEENSAKLCAEEKKLDSVRMNAEWHAKELKSKEEKLHTIKEETERLCGDLQLKEREFNTIGMSIEERREELKLKDDELKSVLLSIEECSKELSILNEKKTSIQTSILECSGELESKERNLASAKKSLKECCEELASKVARLESIQATYGELGKNHVEKEKYFDSLKKIREECLDGLEMREMQFEEQVKEYDLKEQQLLAMQRSWEEKCKEAVEEDCGSFIISSQLKDVQSEDSPVNNAIFFFHSDATTSDQNFRSELNKYVTKTDLANDEVLASLQLSKDPANFVLNVLEGSSKNEVIGFTTRAMSRNVLLLEKLMKVSPKITPQVKEQARKLALVWKSTTELEMQNSDDVLAFLLLVGVYELSPYFREEELLRFAEAVIQQKQAPEICRALGFASMIPDFIKNLIAKKQHIAATRFSCEFGLVDKFPPLQLFKDYLENAIMDAYVSESSSESCEAKCKVIDKEIAALRSILECIADYKLKCSSHVLKFTNRIFELVKQKAEKRCPLQTSNPADESPQESRNYHSLAAPVTCSRSTQQKRLDFRDQLQGKNGNKRRRVDRASDKPSFS